MRSRADAPPLAVLVLRTLGAPERRRLRGRRARPVEHAAAEPVPTTRATVVRADSFKSRQEAGAWLAALRGDPTGAEAELDSALRLLNHALHARRTAAADPYAGDVSADRALVVRLGYGSGQAVAEGRFAAAIELPRSPDSRPRRSMETPDQRFTAILGARETPLVGEELVLRARADLNAGRVREAALEARIALEALLAELPATPDIGALDEHREPVARAANAALHGPLGPAAVDAVTAAVATVEKALRRRRLGR